jgi:hypothetical protein
MLELNWLPALYADPSRWGSLAPLRRAGLHRGDRIVQRVSSQLLAANGLQQRAAAGAPPWALLPPEGFLALARRLGQTALAHCVRSLVDRRSVLQCVALLGPGARERAYVDAERWPALAGLGGAVFPVDTQMLAARGAAVLVALLPADDEGLAERTLLRLPPGTVTAVTLSADASAQAQHWLRETAAEKPH